MMAKEMVSLWEHVVARARKDNEFKAQLKANPVAVLRGQGIQLPPGVQVRVLEDSDRVVHLALPPRPSEHALSEQELDSVVGGALDRGLVSTLAKVFGWNAGQVGQILDADQVPKAPRPSGTPPTSGRSPPSMG